MEDSLRAQVSKFSENPLKTQVGGDHYSKHGKVQPWDVIDEYDLNYYADNAIKYIL